jgi:uncharacterized Zn finger protein (UPF0148 family)
MVVINRMYTLTGEHCETCGAPLAEELDGNEEKCQLCR